MAEINSEVGGFSHSVGKSRKGRKVLVWEHHNLIVTVPDFFFFRSKKMYIYMYIYRASCTLKKGSLVQILGNSTVHSVLPYSLWGIF